MFKLRFAHNPLFNQQVTKPFTQFINWHFVSPLNWPVIASVDE
ncbi:Uncharacterised protein [Vibrio cholerae]|nr:Uncharacterised protein [Vibrio cholerae]CSI58548.1 Uncharacterised protein [Vibrio cholerae]